MKNQYVCDIGDFGKYALLRVFAEAGIKIGVNWYLTEDDGSTDGKYKDYLQKGDLRHYSRDLFDELKKIVEKKEKTIIDIEKAHIIPGACYYSDILKPIGNPAERIEWRRKWFEKGMELLNDSDLIFADPDNGLLQSDDASDKNAEKYVLPGEVEEMFRAGKNVVYYCHKGRRKENAWREYLSIMFEKIKDAKPAVLTYHKGTQRSYVFLIHKKDYKRYRKIIDGFLSRWYRLFSEEYTSKGDVAGEINGETFVVKRKDGVEITIEKRADGRIQTKCSAEPNTTRIMDVEWFCNRIGY